MPNALEEAPITQSIVIWIVCAASIAGVLARPRGIPEWVWAVAGAAALTLFGLVPLRDVVTAVRKGTDVYLFLAGMMVLAELARRESVFEWVASHAVNAARGSRFRLFALVYGVGTLVTIVLSNDATAVVLTPAVAAAVRRAKAEPLPYLLACALVANAASFVLPISNPANLVVFAGAIPSLPRWLAAFVLPSFLAIVATFGMLALLCRRDLRGDAQKDAPVPTLETNGWITIGGILLTALALVVASTVNAPLGLTTFICGAIVFGIAGMRDRSVVADVGRSVSWSVLALVAGLFVLVQGLETTGLLRFTREGLTAIATWWPVLADLGAAFVTAAASNAINNLPAGLIAGSSVAALHGHDALRSAVAIGIDLGPNLSVTGSLATVLWLTALRREKIDVTAWTFLRIGVWAMPVALFLAVLGLAITTR